MPSRVVCDKGHGGGRCREAAIEMAKLGRLQECERCGQPRRYFVRQTYANYETTVEHEVERVARLFSDSEAEDSRYDPMLFLMRNRDTNEQSVWPFYWGIDRNGRWRVGQFPPLLSVEELKKMIQSLEVS